MGDTSRLLRLLSSTIVIGALTGAIVGGLGGRLAMRILFLTTGDEVKGVISDDGFRIGQFTLRDTIGLMIVTAGLGVVAAVLYLAVRPFVAQLGRLAAPAMAAFYGVVAGASLVNPDSLDFRVLEPGALAVALFVAIFAAYGAIVCALVNRAERNRWGEERSWWIVAPPLVVLLLPPLFLIAAIATLLQRGDSPATGWRVVRAGAYATMGGMFTLSAVNLASDVTTLI